MSTESNAIALERMGSSLVIRFTRPEIRNPLSIDVVNELQRILESIGPDIEKVIFTGSGGVFASGANLREIASVTQETAREFALRGQKLMETVAGLKLRTVAAINGLCFGGALDLALSCEKRIAVPEAEFCHPGVGLGIMTGWGGTQRLPKLIGEARALEMFLTARRVSAQEALQFGLIDKISIDLLAESIANEIAKASS